MTLWITTSPSTSSPLPQPQPQPLFLSELTNLIRAKLGPKKAGSSRGAVGIGFPLLALSGIASNTVGALGAVGTGGIKADRTDLFAAGDGAAMTLSLQL